jgi:signal transduction histidine kinase/DNA-binding response OmpR family regulator
VPQRAAPARPLKRPPLSQGRDTSAAALLCGAAKNATRRAPTLHGSRLARDHVRIATNATETVLRPAGSEPPPEAAARRRKVFGILLLRSRNGGLVAALLALFLAYAARHTPQAIWLERMVAGTVLSALARWWVAHRVDRAGPERPARIAYQAAALATALIWGACVAVLTWSADPDTVLLAVVVSAGIAAGGTTTLTAYLGLTYTYLSLLLVPLIVSALASGRTNGAWLAASMVMFATYLFVHARSLNRMLLAALDTEELLQQRAERLEAERARAEAAQQSADAANHAKSAFLANMSHELRTPLTAIIGYAEQLLSADAAETRISYAEVIRRNGEHLLDILNDVLDMSKIEAGKMTVLARPFSLRSLLVDITSLMRPRALQKGLAFELEIGSAFPRAVTADAVRTRQVLINLVGNAIKFTDRGAVRVKVHFDEANLRVRIAVVDTGPGLTRDAQERLFSPFSQADDSPSRAHQGTGLGLFISRRFARMMGGEIQLESVYGEGSTFTLELPVEAADASMLVDSVDESLRPPSRAVSLPADSLAGGRVLLAEDGLDNQRLIATILRQAGAAVDVVGDGEAAVEAALRAREADPYHVILMDMEMPKLDGYGATARLRAAGYRLPIVALTAHAMDAHRERTLTSGCDDHLVKPLDRRALLEAIRKRLPAQSPRLSVAPPRPSAAAPLLFSSLETDDGLRELIPLYMESLKGYALALEAAAERDDRLALAHIAHQLKGTGGSYGYDAITAAATELESVLENGVVDPRMATQRLVTLCRGAIAAHQQSSTQDAGSAQAS